MPLPVIPAAEGPLRPAQRYRPPALLHDIRLLDLLEISGTTLEAGRACGLSQPTVSRRTRALLHDFALRPNRRCPMGCCYGTSTAMRLLRLGCRAHRLSAGVARLGADLFLQPLLAGCHWLLPAPPRFRPVEGWLELVRQGVLDGALVSGLEFQGDAPPQAYELELVRLGEVPLDLALAARPPLAEGTRPLVLVPNRLVAWGLQRALLQQGLSLRTVGNSCHTAAHWLARLERAGLAMPLPQMAPGDWWMPLSRQPLPQPIALPLWLVLPQGWQRQSVLSHTVERLLRGPGRGAGPAGSRC